MANEVQEIKNKLSVEDVLGDYIQLKKAGVNYKACCPFHNEKTPSLMVSPQKQVWHCFGCGEGGDIFTFVQNIENIEFAESLRILAKKAGVVLRKSNPKLRNEKNTLIEISGLAQKFFQAQLFKNAKAEHAKAYIKERGITKESVVQFGIGYSLESWDALLRFLSSRKFKYEAIEKAGLVIKKDRGGYYDRFRDRLMFPIRNVNGEVIGFGGRVLKKDEKSAKYINSPQSLIYNKSEVVYGLYEGKAGIRQNGAAIVVEGYMDVIMNHQVGVTNVVASSGTAFTKEQIQLLKRYTDTLLFCFDTDQAGQAALLRGIDLALAHGMKIRVIIIPDGYGKDPDDCIKKDPDVWKKAITDAVPIIEYYLHKTLQGFRKRSIEDQSADIKFLLEMIQKVPDVIEQTSWIHELSRKVNIESSILQERMKTLRTEQGQEGGTQSRSAQQSKAEPVVKARIQKQEDEHISLYKQLFAIFVVKPQTFTYLNEHIAVQAFKNDFFAAIYKLLVKFYNTNNHVLPVTNDGTFDYQKFIHWVYTEPHHREDEEFTVILKNTDKKALYTSFERLLLQAQSMYAELSFEGLQRELQIIVQRIISLYTSTRIEEISQALDTESDPDKIKQLSKEFNDLLSKNKT